MKGIIFLPYRQIISQDILTFHFSSVFHNMISKMNYILTECLSAWAMILQCNLQFQLQTCCPRYSESLMPNHSNNNYWMSFGDILALALLGGTVHFLSFSNYQSVLQILICFCIITPKFSLIYFLIEIWFACHEIFFSPLRIKIEPMFYSC